MRLIRILLVTHAPLSPECGAGQMAINLAEALREHGHNVTLWSPHPLPAQTKRWQVVRQMQLKFNAFLKTQEPFDVIDCPAPLITQQASKSALVVARSVQPDILYLACDLNSHREISLKSIARTLLDYPYSLLLAFSLLQGWGRAKYILCLGSLESQWMKRWFPWWESKLLTYLNALSKAEQEALTQVRFNRQKQKDLADKIQFIWIGRWAAHKGTTELLNFIEKWITLRPQDTFTIAGCGTETEKKISPELLGSGNLRILPSFDRSQLYSLLASHDVGLFTSRVEGWGLVLNEMLESGMPVFATLAGGVPDLQPFFKEILRPFPPSPELAVNTPIQLETLDNYYKVFSWSETAKLYTERILKELNLPDSDHFS